MHKLIWQPIFHTKSVLYKRFEFDVLNNKVALFVDPFSVKVIPPLNYNF